MKKALAAVVGDQLVDLTLSARPRRHACASSRRTRRRRCRSIGIRRRTCWRPPSPSSSPARSAASARRPTRASSTTSSSSRPFVPGGPREDRGADAGDGQRRPAVRTADVAARRGDRVLQAARRAAQGPAHRREDRRPGASSRATRSRTATRSWTSASGPHVPSTGKLKAFKLLSTSNAYWKGDARNQPMQRIYGIAFFKDDDLKQYLHQIEEVEEARSPQARQGPRPVHVPSVGAGRGVLARQGHDASTTCWPTTCARCSSPPATPR